MKQRCLAVFLALAFLIPAFHPARAGTLNPELGMEFSDAAVIGTMPVVQKGTFYEPEKRSGDVVILKVLKGTPPDKRVAVQLPDNWGAPGFVAWMGTTNFWNMAWKEMIHT